MRNVVVGEISARGGMGVGECVNLIISHYDQLGYSRVCQY